MALSARELFLIVRAENQASGVLRRVGNDVASLGAKEQLRARQAALNLSKMRNENSILDKQSKLRQLTAQAGLKQEQARLMAQGRNLSVQERTSRNVRQQLGNEAERERILKRTTALEGQRANLVQTLAQGSLLQRRGQFVDTNMLDEARGHIHAIDNELKGLSGSLLQNKARFHELGLNMGSIVNASNKMALADRAAAEGEQTLQDRINATQRSLRASYQERANLAAKQRDLNDATKAFRVERLQNGVHLLGSMGRQLQLIGGVGAAALGFAANSAAQLNTQATLAATQIGNNVAQVGAQAQANMDAILKQMQEFPAASSDMASALYDIFSTLNVDGKTGRDILVQVNKAAVAGSLSVKDATAGVLSVLSNFKEIPQTAKGVATALNRSFAAVRFGRITMQEFQTSLQTTAPAARQAGQTFNNLAGTVAFLTRSLGASKASVGYARLLQQFTGQKMIDGLQKHGIAVRNAAGNYRQLNQIVADIAQRFPKLASGQQSAQDFFKAMGGTQGTIQASRAFTTLVQNVSGYQSILRKTTGDNNEFKKSFDAMNQTAGVVWARSLNILKSLWIELGQAALSTIGDLLKPLGELAKSLGDMDKATKDSIGRFLVLAVAISGVTGVVLSLVAAFSGMVLIFDSLSLGTLAGVSAIFLGIATAAYLVITNWDKIKPRLVSYWPTIKSSVQSAVEALTGILENVAGVVAGMIGVVDGLMRGDWGDTWHAAGQIVTNFGSLVQTALSGVGNIIENMFAASMHSLPAFIAGFAITAVSVNKLVGSLKELAAAYKAVAVGSSISTATAEGGMFAQLGAGLGAFMGNLRGLIGLYKMSRAEGNGFFKSLASLLPLLGSGGSIGLGVAAVGAAFVGLYAVVSRFGVQSITPFTSAQAQLVGTANDVTDAINRETGALKGLAGAANAVTSTGLDKAQAALDIRTSRRALVSARSQAGADGRVTAQERDNIAQLVINLKRAQQAYGEASGASATARKHFSDLRASAADALGSTADAYSKTLDQLQRRRDQLNRTLSEGLSTRMFSGGTGPQRLANLHKAIDQVNSAIGNLIAKGPDLQKVPTQIGDYIKAIIPKATSGQIQALFQKMQALGRILTPKEMRIAIKTVGLEKTAKGIDQIDRATAQRRERQIHVAFKLDGKGLSAMQTAQSQFLQHHAATGPGLTIRANADTSSATRKIQQLGSTADKIGKKVVHPTVNTRFKPDAAGVASQATSLGTAAKQGVLTGAQGLGAQLGAQMSSDVIAAINQAKATAKISSPSKLTHDEIGVPLGKGVAKGFEDAGIDKTVARVIMEAVGTGTKVKDAIKQSTQTAVSFFQEAWNTAADQAKTNFGDLFQGTDLQTKIDWGAKLNITDLQTDLAKQDRTFRTFNRNLARLNRRGAPSALIDQLRELGPSANDELTALNGATKKQLRAYFRLYDKSQKDIRRATKTAFNQQRREWTAHGRSLAAGIILGLRQAGPQLQRYFTRLWRNLIRDARRHNKSNSPSRLYAVEGKNIIDGLRLGMERAARGMHVPMPGLPGNGQLMYRGGGGGNTYIYQTIHAHHSESLQTTLAKSNFRLKHRNR